MKKGIKWLLALAIIVCVVAMTLKLVNRPIPVGVLTEHDKQMIVEEVRKETQEDILEIIPRDTAVIVNTGTDGVCWNCFELVRTKQGWKIVWMGS